MKVSHLLNTKGKSIVIISPDASVDDLVRLLADNNIGAVVVADANGIVKGIVSERDVVRGLTGGRAFLDEPVRAIMRPEPYTCTHTDDVDEIMVLMTDKRIRHVPVIDQSGALTGIVSIGDVVKSRIEDLEFEREQLSSYLSQ